MKNFLFIFIFVFIFPFLVFSQGTNNAQNFVENTGPRHAVCDQCGYCPPNPPPQSWEKCRQCLYPQASSDPSKMETLLIDPETNLPVSPIKGKMFTFLGCLGVGGGTSFEEKESVGNFTQTILNIIFSIIGGVAFLYLLYGGFIIATSQSDPEKINYGKRLINGAIIGLVFSLFSVFLVNFIFSNILKLPSLE